MLFDHVIGWCLNPNILFAKHCFSLTTRRALSIGSFGLKLMVVGHVSSIAGPKYCPLQFCFYFFVLNYVAVIGLLGGQEDKTLGSQVN
jgi:hypothetical protein